MGNYAVPNLTGQGKTYVMPDNVFVDIFSVSLPTANTGCSVVLFLDYTVTDGVNGGAHMGEYLWSFCNNAGTVTGSGTDGGEAFSGTGAASGADTLNVNVVGTTATAQVRFNNTLSVNGSMTIRVVASTASVFTIL